MTEIAGVAPRLVRCAIYTRKSTEEGLDKDFNSLDAQREAAEAYIVSQHQEGWLALPHAYNDGGFTGTNTERPALDQLMAEVAAGGIDCVVVYKVDRLSRSLLDFARLMAVFEQRGVSFVSVTQQFNTRTPVGRLTLHILLSFAQFEQEIISERTRDKKAAAKRKGKWTGGFVPLGYDLDPYGGRLLVNEAEAGQVRAIFQLFAEKRSLAGTLQELQRRGWTTKSWVTEKQKRHAGAEFTEDTLRRLLANGLYAGVVSYRGHRYRGEQERIVAPSLWKRVQQRLAFAETQSVPKKPTLGALLTGLLDCGGCGKPMAHTSNKRGDRCYRYYVCRNANCVGRPVAAAAFEASVLEQLSSLTKSHGGAGVQRHLQKLGPQWRLLPVAELKATLQAVVERLTYDSASGEVAIRLRASKEKRHA